MPYARIEIASGRRPEEKRALLAAVDAVFVATLGIPPNDAFLRLFEFAGENVLVPSHHGERFTFVEIQLFPGRESATKGALYRALTDAFVALGVPPRDLVIALIEIPRQDWGIDSEALPLNKQEGNLMHSAEVTRPVRFQLTGTGAGDAAITPAA